jgi:hypothetical protein
LWTRWLPSAGRFSEFFANYVEITYDATFLIGGATAYDWSLGPIRKLAEELKGVEFKFVDASSK